LTINEKFRFERVKSFKKSAKKVSLPGENVNLNHFSIHTSITATPMLCLLFHYSDRIRKEEEHIIVDCTTIETIHKQEKRGVEAAARKIKY
jgi:hypothetical protein